jgi:ectoine hydroxylase-related dioxygenase (phytanoyl-CoA dioxygenase family)
MEVLKGISYVRSFLPHQTKEIKKYYEEYGYVVVKKVISNEQIDFFAKGYDTIKRYFSREKL